MCVCVDRWVGMGAMCAHKSLDGVLVAIPAVRWIGVHVYLHHRRICGLWSMTH